MEAVATKIAGIWTLTLVFTLAGCSQLPDTYRRIELGKPLEATMLPADAVVEPDWDTPSSKRSVTEYHQVALPVGMVRYILDVHADESGKVASVELEENAVFFYALLLTGHSKTSKRWLVNGDEKAEEVATPGLIPFWSPLYPMGLHQCFGAEAKEWRRWHAPAANPTTQPD